MDKTIKPSFGYVPCNGCVLCCVGDAVRLLPEDYRRNYFTEKHPYLAGELMIAHKENGDCIYLDKTGCSIHDTSPVLCRIADCRSLALKFNFDQAMELHRLGRINIKVWDKGNQLIDEERNN